MKTPRKSRNRASTSAAAVIVAAAAVNADLAAASDLVAAIGPPPDAPTVPAAPPAPLRVSVGTAAHVDPSNVPPCLQFNGGTINGIGTPKRRDPLTVVPVALTADDAPTLYARAALLLAAASGASVNAPDRIGASPLDRMQFLARAAERCIYAADRVRPGTRPVRSFSGGFNGTDATRIRIAYLSCVADLPLLADLTEPIPSADVCDPLIVAHLAARPTTTRPDGGYFAVNVGTIDR